MYSYFDPSFKKLTFLLLACIALMVSVTVTFAWKRNTFGSTPFFNSVSLLGEKIYIYTLFTLKHTVPQTAVALIPFLDDEQNTAQAAMPARAIPVLTYHRLEPRPDNSNVTIGNFMDQMSALKEAGWQTITLADYLAFMQGTKDLPERSFLLTFDDGAQQSFYPVDPVLDILGFNAVNYIIVASSREPQSTYYLSEPEIEHMLETGRWEIGSHSFNAHRPYKVNAEGNTGIFYSDKLWVESAGRLENTEEFTARVRKDLTSAREALEERYGVRIDTFAFPFVGEVGHTAAQNFADGERITADEASHIYTLGWIQNEDGEDFSFNYPEKRAFLSNRIHVDHDWSGTRLLRDMENGLPKSLPFTDDMTRNRGWLPSWGNVQAGGILFLSALPSETSASSILDGSLLWDDYEFTTMLNWDHGYALLLADVMHSKIYRSCVFSKGKVQIQDTRGDETRVLATGEDLRITYGSGERAGIRSVGTMITCLWNGVEVLTVSGQPNRKGGVGVQTWDPLFGNAQLIFTYAEVQKL